MRPSVRHYVRRPEGVQLLGLFEAVDITWRDRTAPWELPVITVMTGWYQQFKTLYWKLHGGMSNPGGATISADQLKARYVGTGTLCGDVDFWYVFLFFLSADVVPTRFPYTDIIHIPFYFGYCLPRRTCRYEQTVSWKKEGQFLFLCVEGCRRVIEGAANMWQYRRLFLLFRVQYLYSPGGNHRRLETTSRSVRNFLSLSNSFTVSIVFLLFLFLFWFEQIIVNGSLINIGIPMLHMWLIMINCPTMQSHKINRWVVPDWSSYRKWFNHVDRKFFLFPVPLDDLYGYHVYYFYWRNRLLGSIPHLLPPRSFLSLQSPTPQGNW